MLWSGGFIRPSVHPCHRPVPQLPPWSPPFVLVHAGRCSRCAHLFFLSNLFFRQLPRDLWRSHHITPFLRIFWKVLCQEIGVSVSKSGPSITHFFKSISYHKQLMPESTLNIPKPCLVPMWCWRFYWEHFSTLCYWASKVLWTARAPLNVTTLLLSATYISQINHFLICFLRKNTSHIFPIIRCMYFSCFVEIGIHMTITTGQSVSYECNCPHMGVRGWSEIVGMILESAF